jgi:diguanylate cyclase (GGDEF)-like protein
VLVVMVLDSLLFTTGVFVGNPNFVTILAALVVAKSIATTYYAGLIAVYARLIETPGGKAPEDGPMHDLFHGLTYRQRYEQARSRMTRDALTGLFNRGYFDETAPRHLAHANRAVHQMSLVMLDVDRLKETNDRHGHQAGDALLTFVARQVEQMVRSSDVACRYGGDEFIVVLTTADARAARTFSERLLDLVQTRSLEQAPVPPWAPATVTIGLAVYPDDGLTLPELVLRADERLYAGKRQGGARLVTSSSAERS